MSESVPSSGLPELSERARRLLGGSAASAPNTPSSPEVALTSASVDLPAPVPTPVPTKAGPTCASCGAAALTLADALHQAEQGTLSLGHGAVNPSLDQIVRWLRAPQLPTEKPRRRRDIWGPTFFSALASVVIILTGLMITAILGPYGPFIGIPLTLGVLALVIVSAQRRGKNTTDHPRADYEQAMLQRAWDRRMEIWERLLLCPSCGIVCDPQTGRRVDWHSLPDLYLPASSDRT